MFCPRCKDEYRPGFTRCAVCDVDLVENLPGPSVTERSGTSGGETRGSPTLVPMAEYCGFLELGEARRARDQLRLHSIRSEILIRDLSESFPDGPVVEEFWLRVERDRYKDVLAVLGFDEATGEGTGETFSCSECGRAVAVEETFCPECGARFEDA